MLVGHPSSNLPRPTVARRDLEFPVPSKFLLGYQSGKGSDKTDAVEPEFDGPATVADHRNQQLYLFATILPWGLDRPGLQANT
jgi:hypothetical protein